MSQYYSFGEEQTTRAPAPDTADRINGSGWSAARGQDGQWVLSFIAADHGGNEVTAPISEQQAERLRTDKSAFTEVARGL